MSKQKIVPDQITPLFVYILQHGRIQRGGGGGGRGSRTPLKNHQNIGIPSNTGPDPLKNHNNHIMLPSQQSMLGHHRHASEMLFKWHSAGWPMLARLLWY